jgi:hypothetical protein
MLDGTHESTGQSGFLVRLHSFSASKVVMAACPGTSLNLYFLLFTKRTECRGTNVSEKLIVVQMVKIYPSLIGRMSVLRGELLRFEWRRSPT